MLFACRVALAWAFVLGHTCAWLTTPTTTTMNKQQHYATGRRALFDLSATQNKEEHSSSSSNSKPQFQQQQYAVSPTPKTKDNNQRQKKSGSKFGQPKFAQSSTSSKSSSSNSNIAQNSKKRAPRPKFGADSQIASRHTERLKMAGREGTKRYQNPNKVFLGNLNFTVTDTDLQQFLSTEFALPTALLLKQCKVVRDWKTQESKGYGFAVFTEPLYGTVCLEKLDGKLFRGRKMKVQPGYKAAPDPQIYIEQKRQKRLAREAAGIFLDEEPEPAPMLEPMEVMLLRKLDPDLVDEATVKSLRSIIDNNNNVKELVVTQEGDGSGFDDDGMLFGEEFGDEDDDDDESGVDGYWFGDDDDDDNKDETVEFDEDETIQNREERRKESRKNKKKKLNDKGFG